MTPSAPGVPCYPARRVFTTNGIGTLLYGHADLQAVTAERCVSLQQQGFLPYSYRAVKWFVFLYLPVVPLGTFRVIRTEQSFWSVSAHYLLEPAPFAWRQVLAHYAVGWSIVLALALVLIKVL